MSARMHSMPLRPRTTTSTIDEDRDLDDYDDYGSAVRGDGTYRARSPSDDDSDDDEQPCDLRLLTPNTCLREYTKTTHSTITTPSILPPPSSIAAAAAVAAAAAAAASVTQITTMSSLASPLAAAASFAAFTLPQFKMEQIPSLTPIVSVPGGAYSCERCGNSYARPHSLNRHKRFECGVEPKFECPICHKKSKHKHNLVLHMRTHQHR